jgi:phage-related baseplate assembly protein
MSLEETEQQIRNYYLQKYKEKTGREGTLADADAKTLLIKAFAAIEYQTMQYIEAKGQAELLKTSTGDALDALSALLGILRKDSSRATATERFYLAGQRGDVVAIPAGTRVKTQGGKYFNTVDYGEVKQGETYADILIQAEEAGTESSGVLEGDINILVDPIAYVSSVENITESTGGLDIEDDDNLTERVYLAPSKFSCAGPKDAYEYYVREWRTDVGDVQVVSPSACVIALYAVLENGDLLSDAEMESLLEYMSDEKIRPLGDKVICETPEEIEYDLNFTYYIASSDQKSASTIQEAVEEATQAYITWQRKLGRDVNPTELIARIRDAGAKRVNVSAPTDVALEKTQIPKLRKKTVMYGGLEDG